MPDFSSTAGLTLNSSTTTTNSVPGDGTVLRLAGTQTFDAGSTFATTPRNVAAGFSTSFAFRLTSPGGLADSTGATGADGLVFVVQRGAATALGGSGSGIGYQNLGNSVGIEFDTWRNVETGDPTSNHVGINTGGSVTSVATAAVAPDFDNGARWTAWVDYSGSMLEVRVSQDGIRPTAALLTQAVNLASALGGTSAYVGFTAGTGAAYGNHDLLSWAFSDTYLAGGLTLFSWSGAGAWTDPAHWNPGAIPGSSDVAMISGGTATVSEARSIGALQLSGGAVGGSGTLTLTGAGLRWSGGALIGTGTLKLAAGTALELSGTADKVYHRADGNGSGGRVIENFGTIIWSGTGQLLGGDGAQIINRAGGTFLIQNDATLGYTGGGAGPTVTNQGTLRKATATGTTTISGGSFINSGTVEAQSGTLAFSSGVTSSAGAFTATANGTMTFAGGQNFNDGTSFSSPSGQIRIAGGATTLSGQLTASGLDFAGGDLYGSATIGGNLAWTAGTWRGADTITFSPGSVLTLSGAADKSLVRGDGNGSGGRILRTGGTLAWTDAGRIVGNDGAGVDVLAGGVLELRSDSSLVYGGGGNIPFLSNAGTVRKLASAGASTFAGVAFTNTGRLELLGGELSLTGQAGLANQGVVEVVAGTLTSSASGMTSTSGTFEVLSGAQLRYTGGTNTIASSAFNGTGLTEVAGGTLLVSDSTIGGNFRLSSGKVGGSGLFTVSSGGSFTWSGGALTGTGTLAVATGGALQISGGDPKSFYRDDGNGSGGRIVNNAGITTWSGAGSLLGGDGAAFSNLAGGVFDAQGDATFGYTGGGNGPTFTNAGTVRKSAGTGATVLALPLFNSGKAESLSGTLRLTGGGSGNGQFLANGGVLEFASSYTLNDGARLLGSTLSRLTTGALTVPASATATVGGIGAGNFSLDGGTVDGEGVLAVGNSGKMTWTGGSLTGRGVLRVEHGGVLNVLGSMDHSFYRGDGNGSGGRTIENFGTITWSEGNILGGDGAQFINQAGGLLDVTGGGTLGYTGGGNAPTFLNAGTWRKSAGSPTTVTATNVTTSGLVQVNSGSFAFASAVTSNAGSFFAAPGTTLTFGGGQTFNTGTSITGPGLIQATAGATTFNGTINAARFVLAGGSLYGTATITGVLEWTGGDMRGAGTLGIAAGSTLLVSGTGDRAFFRGDGNGSGGRVFENFGQFLVENAGNLLGGDGAQIVNRAGGVLELRNDRTLGYTGGGNPPALLNEGTLRKTIGSGTSTIASTGVTQNGLVEVRAGTLNFASGVTSNGGQFAVSSGAALEFSGGQTLNNGTSITGLARATAGATTLSGNVALGSFELAGGSLYGTATVASGELKWTGGDLRGASTLTIAPGASLLLAGAGDRTWLRGDGNGSGGRIIENRGTMMVENAGNLLGNDGAQLINRPEGTISLRNDATIGYGGGGNGPTFTNEGTLAKTAGTGTSTIAIPFVNTGSILISSGSLAFTAAFTNSRGSIALANGASFATAGPLDLGTAPLSGTGTITAAAVTAGGLVSPGNSPGRLTLTGNLTLLATTNTLMELGGPSQGTDYDFLSVGGSGALAGALQVSFLNNYGWNVPSNSTFTVLTASNGLTGSFANVAPGQRLFTSDGIGSFQVNYGASSLFAPGSVVLSNFIVTVPEPSAYLMLALGSAVLLLRHRRRQGP